MNNTKPGSPPQPDPNAQPTKGQRAHEIFVLLKDFIGFVLEHQESIEVVTGKTLFGVPIPGNQPQPGQATGTYKQAEESGSKEEEEDVRRDTSSKRE